MKLAEMKQYIQNLLPRLQQFSDRLDRKESFVNKPWVLIDEEGNRHIYVFQRDKSLVMSFNGKAQIGRWEYIQAANSLLIDRITDKILLNSAFVEKGLMILKMDGSPDRPWVLINEEEVPDLDAERYVRELFIQKLNLKTIVVQDRLYYFSDQYHTGITSKTKFLNKDFETTKDTFDVVERDKVFTIQNGIVNGYYVILKLETDQGEVVVKTHNPFSIALGDRVFQKDSIAGDGTYKIYNGNHKTFSVSNGKIIQIKQKNISLAGGIFIVICIGLFVVAFVMKNEKQKNKVSVSFSASKPKVVKNSDVTLAPMDSTTVSSTTSVLYTTEDCKQKIISFLEAINDRQFSSLKNYFPTIVPKYFNNRNLFCSDVVDQIEKYWTETLAKGFTVYDTSHMIAGKDGKNYFVDAEQFQISTNRNDRVPLVYYSRVRYLLSPELKIISVTGKILHKEYDYHTLFGMEENDPRDPDEFVKNATEKDFDLVFNRLTSGNETPEYKQALKEAIIEKFGGETPIYLYSSIPPVSISLRVFCDGLLSGVYRYYSTRVVYRSSSGELTRLEIAYIH